MGVEDISKSHSGQPAEADLNLTLRSASASLPFWEHFYVRMQLLEGPLKHLFALSLSVG